MADEGLPVRWQYVRRVACKEAFQRDTVFATEEKNRVPIPEILAYLNFSRLQPEHCVQPLAIVHASWGTLVPVCLLLTEILADGAGGVCARREWVERTIDDRYFPEDLLWWCGCSRKGMWSRVTSGQRWGRGIFSRGQYSPLRRFEMRLQKVRSERHEREWFPAPLFRATQTLLRAQRRMLAEYILQEHGKLVEPTHARTGIMVWVRPQRGSERGEQLVPCVLLALLLMRRARGRTGWRRWSCRG